MTKENQKDFNTMLKDNRDMVETECILHRLQIMMF